METLENKVSTIIKCNAEKIYNLITTPINWVGLHPVTEAVYGPTIHTSGKIKDVWVEHINNKQRPAPVNAVWTVTEADPYKKWEIKSVFFGGAEVVITITYYFEKVDNKILFTRVMKTQAKEGYLTEEQKAAYKSIKSHQEYLEKIKKYIEE